jgi:5'-nucleotidase
VGVVGLGRTPDGFMGLDRTANVVQRSIEAFGSLVDAIVVLSHLGRDGDLALVPKTQGIDVILGGHSHDVFDPPRTALDCGGEVRSISFCDPRPVTVVHSGAYGRYLGRLDLTVSSDPADLGGTPFVRRSAVVASRYSLLPVNDALPERGDLVDLLEPYREALVQAGLEQPVAFAPAAISRRKPARGDSALGNFVTAAMRAVARADLAVINSTGVRADLPQGEVTMDDFFEVLPFEDSLVIMNISGADLEKAFTDLAEDSCARDRVTQAEVDGVSLALGCPRAASAEVPGGEAIQAHRTYRVALASFVTEQGGWFSGLGTVVERGPPIRDVVIAAARSGRPCAANHSALPCIDAGSGAVVDGRISWR